MNLTVHHSAMVRTGLADDAGPSEAHGMQGTTKRLKISRSVMDGSGKSQRVQVAKCILAAACYAVKHGDAAAVTLLVGRLTSVHRLQLSELLRELLLSELLLLLTDVCSVDCLHAQPHDPNGHEQETLSVDIKPGWKGGTRITFDGKGALRAACIATGTTSAPEHAESAHGWCPCASAPVMGVTRSMRRRA